ncbi:hypothetical protein TWF730_000152 [Orbilia blumenaviensis]|uniref:Uncharacterized protein n=1 Tax=Orbilia blumenaviensis TaxID=1796055 RepID=A0AAV9VNW1_9PEZI
MHFFTTGVFSLCVAATLAAPARSSRRSTMNTSQKALGETVDRVLVDIPLAAAQIVSCEIGAPASSLKFPNSMDMGIEESDVIRIEVDVKSLRRTKKDPACGDAFRRRKHDDDEDMSEVEFDDRLAIFRKEQSGLWSVRCAVSPITEEIEMPPVFSDLGTEEIEPIPEVIEGEETEDPKETKEISEEITEVTTEVTTKVTTKVTTEVRTKNSVEETTEESSEPTIDDMLREEAERKLEEESLSFHRRSVDSEADDDEDQNSKRGVGVNEFDIEIL